MVLLPFFFQGPDHPQWLTYMVRLSPTRTGNEWLRSVQSFLFLRAWPLGKLCHCSSLFIFLFEVWLAQNWFLRIGHVRKLGSFPAVLHKTEAKPRPVRHLLSGTICESHRTDGLQILEVYKATGRGLLFDTFLSKHDYITGCRMEYEHILLHDSECICFLHIDTCTNGWVPLIDIAFQSKIHRTKSSQRRRPSETQNSTVSLGLQCCPPAFAAFGGELLWIWPGRLAAPWGLELVVSD